MAGCRTACSCVQPDGAAAIPRKMARTWRGQANSEESGPRNPARLYAQLLPTFYAHTAGAGEASFDRVPMQPAAGPAGGRRFAARVARSGCEVYLLMASIQLRLRSSMDPSYFRNVRTPVADPYDHAFSHPGHSCPGGGGPAVVVAFISVSGRAGIHFRRRSCRLRHSETPSHVSRGRIRIHCRQRTCRIHYLSGTCNTAQFSVAALSVKNPREGVQHSFPSTDVRAPAL